MDRLIELFPEQLEQALNIGKDSEFSCHPKKLEQVLISGLGGSGIGGTIVQNFAATELSIPIVVNKSYDLPAFVGPNSLVVICSYSGNTEETISTFQQAIEKDAFIVCITSGGTIASMAEERGIPLIKVPGGMPPRSCLGYSIVQILFVLYYSGLISSQFITEINSAVTLLQENQKHIKNLAIALAQKSYGKMPVIYAGWQMEGVAIRWRQQVNENSKMTAWENVVPEMNHNELVGWCDVQDNLAVFFLHSASDHPKVMTRMEINKTIIRKCTDSVYDVQAMGNNYWEQAFSLIHVGDWYSWYLSNLRQVDAMEVAVIDFLKKELAAN